MTKFATTLTAILFALISLSSCSNGNIEADAKKVAEIQCKAQKAMQNTSGADLMTASATLMQEASELSKEMEGKYSSDSDKKKFAEALLKEMANCN